jgi:3-methyladenine DNA glycosylase AlkD
VLSEEGQGEAMNVKRFAMWDLKNEAFVYQTSRAGFVCLMAYDSKEDAQNAVDKTRLGSSRYQVRMIATVEPEK